MRRITAFSQARGRYPSSLEEEVSHGEANNIERMISVSFSFLMPRYSDNPSSCTAEIHEGCTKLLNAKFKT
jgi:hypothetical protein